MSRFFVLGAILVRLHDLGGPLPAPGRDQYDRVMGEAAGPKTAARLTAAMVAEAALTGGLSACSAAPAQDILGSFFPAWMLCAVLGIAASVILRLGLGAVGLAAFVPLPAVTFITVAVAMTLLIWLIWFGH